MPDPTIEQLVGKIRATLARMDDTPSGFCSPRVYRAETRTLSRLETNLRRAGKRICRYEGSPVPFVKTQTYRPAAASPEQLCAIDHAEACRRLDLTPAGAKARELLFSHLDDSQRESAIVNRYFDFRVANPYYIQADLADGKPVSFSTANFRILRGFPNGNIFMARAGDARFTFQVCLHPVTPYPTDDIVLGQMILILAKPDWFVRHANITKIGTHEPVEFVRMFARIPDPPELIVPQSIKELASA